MSDFYGEDLSTIHASSFEALAEAAAKTFVDQTTATSGRILDLGCGAGPFSEHLAAEGYEMWGLDVSSSLIDLARQRLPDANFHVGSVDGHPLPSASGAAAIGEVLNYASADDSGALTRMAAAVAEALTPGALFLFDMAAPGRHLAPSVYSEGDDWAVGMQAGEDGEILTRHISTFRLIEGSTWRRASETHRLRLWEPEEVEAIFSEAGFEVTRTPYAGLSLPPRLIAFAAVREG